MATTRSASRKGKRRADSIEGQPPQVSAPPVARPAKKRKLEETDALDAVTVASSPRARSNTRTKRKSEELTRRRQKARLLREASTRVQVQLDKPKSPSPVALPTPRSVKEEHVEDDNPVANVKDVDGLTALRAEVAAKDRIIESYAKSLQALQNLAQCQVCLEPMQKPYALVPCGHTSCLTCLQSWFRAPPPNNQEEEDTDIPAPRRKKTCPQCRSVVTQRPVGVFLIRDFANHVEKMLSVHEGRPPAVPQEEVNAGADPWEGIFPAFTNRAADGVIIDYEDGAVVRCPECTWEMYDGMCEGCGRVFTESDEELDEDTPTILMRMITDRPYRRYPHLRGPRPPPFYAQFDEFDGDEYDTPAEYEFEMDQHEGSFIDDGEQEQEEGSRDSTPGLETYEDAQTEHSHSPSQHSSYSDQPNRRRRQSIEILPDEPFLNITLSAEAEDWAGPLDSGDERQVMSSDNGSEHEGYEQSSQWL